MAAEEIAWFAIACSKSLNDSLSSFDLTLSAIGITVEVTNVSENLLIVFPSIVSADDVVNSKPDPETYLKGAQELGVLPQECLVFEDAPKGVEAAKLAGMKAVVITTMHEAEEFAQYDNIVCFIKDYQELNIDSLIHI